MNTSSEPKTQENYSTAHGTLLCVHGLGVLIQGKSGIGKSECALELISRGHSLVADDVVQLSIEENRLVGKSPDLVKNLLEIRGLGIVNIRELYGVTAVRDSQYIDIVIELMEWQNCAQIDRLGADAQYTTLLGTAVSKLVIPVRSGRSLGIIIEMAARNELLRRSGCNTALSLQDRLTEFQQKSALESK